jgi:hypothetical protein
MEEITKQLTEERTVPQPEKGRLEAERAYLERCQKTTSTILMISQASYFVGYGSD